MFSDNTKIISNGSLILYHEIEILTRPYNVGVIRTINVQDGLIDKLIEGVENDFINRIYITVNFLNIPATNPYNFEFSVLNAYKDLNDFVVEFCLDDTFGCDFCEFNCELIYWIMSYHNIIYKIDNVHK